MGRVSTLKDSPVPPVRLRVDRVAVVAPVALARQMALVALALWAPRVRVVSRVVQWALVLPVRLVGQEELLMGPATRVLLLQRGPVIRRGSSRLP